LIFRDAVEGLRSPVLIIFTLSVVAALMLFTEKVKKGSEGLGMDKISRKDALIIGIAQALALVPGVSRSGITIVAGLMRGVQRQAAARFSFLMSTPIIAGAGFLETRKLVLSGDAAVRPDLFLAGIAVSAVTGYIAIKYLLRFLQNHSLNPFAYYRFLLAFVIIITVWTNR
ncbi:MAG TPA: undecaprenyl-diphosphate phosphatase, partial [Nitrospirae bacterium]|nr:undecaprenyl-diphosphate phosphatase [Nitrospirota bacterium]